MFDYINCFYYNSVVTLQIYRLLFIKKKNNRLLVIYMSIRLRYNNSYDNFTWKSISEKQYAILISKLNYRLYVLKMMAWVLYDFIVMIIIVLHNVRILNQSI